MWYHNGTRIATIKDTFVISQIRPLEKHLIHMLNKLKRREQSSQDYDTPFRKTVYLLGIAFIGAEKALSWTIYSNTEVPVLGE